MSRETISVRRPQRWDQPLDPSMTASDVEWLLKQPPLCDLNPNVFPKATPLPDIVRNECRLIRCLPGEVIAREGDYVASAFLVLAGSVQAFLSQLPGEVLGRTEPEKKSWLQAAINGLFPSRWPETRTPDEISSTTASNVNRTVGQPRPAVFIQDLSGLMSQHRAVELGPGEMFGEVAAMYRTPLAITVAAQSEATILEIRWQGLRLLHRDPQLGRQLDHHYRNYWLLVHLRETPLLRFLPEDALRKVAEAAQLQSFGRMEWHADYRRAQKLSIVEQIEAEPVVALEGNAPTDLILIRSGFGRLCRRHGVGWQTLAYLGKGAMFGLREIAHNYRHQSNQQNVVLQESLRAIGFVDTINIPVEAVAEHILPYVREEELPAPIQSTPAMKQRPADDETFLHLPIGLLEFLGQTRLNNGREAMVIDLDRCTRCDDCVTACANNHNGNPRFVRGGPRWGSFQVAEACMHCADPVCMIGCPTGAIARNLVSGAISIHDSVCIGCGVCASACPYENIRMAAIRDRAGRPLFDENSGQPILKATKCDLCTTLPSGPACQQACPHQALVRIDLSDAEQVAEWLERRK